jgi:hypothetical protein
MTSPWEFVIVCPVAFPYLRFTPLLGKWLSETCHLTHCFECATLGRPKEYLSRDCTLWFLCGKRLRRWIRPYRHAYTRDCVSFWKYNIAFSLALCYSVSRDSAVGIATGYWLDDRGLGVWVPVGSRIFTSPCRPDRPCGPPNLLSNGYRGLFRRVSSGRVVNLTTHLQLVPRLRKCGSIHPLPITPPLCSA